MFVIRHRLAVIGLGHWGRKYVRVATQLGATVVVCHTRGRGNDATWLAEEHPSVRHATSLQEALEHRIDAVAIVTPRRSHAAMTLECLRRGLHVLVEKPAATSVADLELTHAEARARGLVLHTGYTHRFDLGLQRLGEVARRATEPNWRFTWCKPAPGTGVAELIWEYYPHVFSIADLMGDIDVDAMKAARLRATRGPSGTATVAVDLPTGAGTGRVEVASGTGLKHKGIQLCDGREIVAEWSDRRLWDVHWQQVLEAPEEPLVGQLRNFLDAVGSPGEHAGSSYALDRFVTDQLVQLSTKAQLAGLA